ncbi:MAG: hypothetical protein K2J80_03960 [Oscillospiraceae bacterium]|nr:hypothetical protein [Oscillospiraceae bacterium]
MINALGKLFADILQIITSRYVVSGRAIPEDVLRLKDEAMSVYEKSRGENNSAVLEQYARRLGEIKEALEKEEQS